MRIMRGWTAKTRLRPGRLQRLGDEPGEALVIADAGDQRHFAAQIDRNHTPLLRCDGCRLVHLRECRKV